MSQILPINMDPGMAAQAIRPSVPQGGAPTAGPAPTTPSRGVINPQAGRVYDRMFARQDDMRDRREYLEDQKRIRRQTLRDDVRDRNRKIEDEDRKRLEYLDDRDERYRREDEIDAREYERGAYDRSIKKRKDEEFFKTLERQRKQTNKKLRTEKTNELIKAKTAYAKLLDIEAGNENLKSFRKHIIESRQAFAQQRQTNKEQLASNVLVDLHSVVSSESLSGDEEDMIDALVQQIAYSKGVPNSDTLGYTDIVGLDKDVQLLIANQLIKMAESGSMTLGGIQGMVKTRLETHAEVQKDLNEKIVEYDKMWQDVSSKESDPNAMAGLKEMYRERIIELGGDVDGFQPRVDEEDTEEKATEEEGEKAEGGEGDQFNEFLNEREKSLGEIGESEEKIEELEGAESIPGKVVEGAGNVIKGIKDSGVTLGDVGSAIGDNAEVIVGGGILANEARKKLPNVSDAINKSPIGNEGKKQQLLEKLKKATFPKPEDYNKFLKDNLLPEYNKPMPDGSGRKGDDLKRWLQWQQGYFDHVNTQIESRTKTFFNRVKAHYKGKTAASNILKGFTWVTIVSQGVDILKDIAKVAGYVPDELQEEYDRLKSLKEKHRALLLKQKDVGKMIQEEAKSGGLDASSAPTARGIEGLDESNATSQEIQGAMNRMEEDGDFAPIPQTIKP